MLEVPKTDRSQKISTFQSQVTCWRHQQLRGVCFHTSQEKNAWFTNKRASLGAQLVKNPPAMQETWVWSLGWEYPLEEGMPTHSSILAWKIPWTEKPGGLQSVGSQGVGHDYSTKHSTAPNKVKFTICQPCHNKVTFACRKKQCIKQRRVNK